MCMPHVQADDGYKDYHGLKKSQQSFLTLYIANYSCHYQFEYYYQAR